MLEAGTGTQYQIEYDKGNETWLREVTSWAATQVTYPKPNPKVVVTLNPGAVANCTIKSRVDMVRRLYEAGSPVIIRFPHQAKGYIKSLIPITTPDMFEIEVQRWFDAGIERAWLSGVAVNEPWNHGLSVANAKKFARFNKEFFKDLPLYMTRSNGVWNQGYEHLPREVGAIPTFNVYYRVDNLARTKHFLSIAETVNYDIQCCELNVCLKKEDGNWELGDKLLDYLDEVTELAKTWAVQTGEACWHPLQSPRYGATGDASSWALFNADINGGVIKHPITRLFETGKDIIYG